MLVLHIVTNSHGRRIYRTISHRTFLLLSHNFQLERQYLQITNWNQGKLFYLLSSRNSTLSPSLLCSVNTLKIFTVAVQVFFWNHLSHCTFAAVLTPFLIVGSESFVNYTVPGIQLDYSEKWYLGKTCTFESENIYSLFLLNIKKLSIFWF